MRFVFYLWLIFNQLPNHKPAISGVDLIINDINNPYSQQEINAIADIIVIKSGEDITNELVLVEDEYLNNERTLGYFKQIYEIVVLEFDGKEYYNISYRYVLTILNISFNNEYEDILINTNPDKYLSINDILKYLEEELKYEIFQHEIVSNDYFDNGTEGDYLIELIITNKKNKKQHLKINIASYFEEEKAMDFKFILLSAILGLIGLIIIVSLVIRRKKK